MTTEKFEDISPPLFHRNQSSISSPLSQWGHHRVELEKSANFKIGKVEFIILPKIESLEISYRYQQIENRLVTPIAPIALDENNTLELRLLPTLPKHFLRLKLEASILVTGQSEATCFVTFPLNIKMTVPAFSRPLLEINSELQKKTSSKNSKMIGHIHTTFCTMNPPAMLGVSSQHAILPIRFKNETNKNIHIDNVEIDFTGASLFSQLDSYFTSQALITFGQHRERLSWDNLSHYHQFDHFLVQSASRE
jgi:hypothetical protein